MHIENEHSPAIVLKNCLLQLGQTLGLAVKLNPAELSKSLSRAAVAASSESSECAPEESSTEGRWSDDESFGVFIDCCAVIIAQLSGEAERARLDWKAAQSSVAQHVKRAAVALTWVAQEMRADLNLFLVGPLGSGDSEHWAEFAAQTERNEQVCRKMVWLPPTDPARLESSAIAFCNRTFLARPWQAKRTSTPGVQLDPLTSLLKVDARMALWVKLAEDPSTDDTEFTDALMKAIGGAEGQV